MSNLVNRLNGIKRICTLDWFTPSQLQAWKQLQLSIPFREVINLYGPPGSGKTFMAWVFTRQEGATYIPNIETLKTAGENCTAIPVIDNVHPTRHSFRTALKYLSFQKHKQGIVITQEAIPDDCYRVALVCTTQDREHVYQKIRSIDPGISFRDGGTLHHLINPDLPLVLLEENYD